MSQTQDITTHLDTIFHASVMIPIDVEHHSTQSMKLLSLFL